MRGRTDAAQFMKAFAGDNRYIVDYLIEEVLQRQPERIRNSLLQTSILDQLSGPLCDSVTGQNDGMALLDALERGNLFVVRLDDTRHWFCYHHLFADVLAGHALQEQSAHIPILHQRASAWYADNDLPADAIRHALAAKDFARAADLVELAVPAMGRTRQEAMIVSWLKELPGELFHARPVLSVYYAAALLVIGELQGVETRLLDAERWLYTQADMDTHPVVSSTGKIALDDEGVRGLRGSIALYRASIALAMGDVAGTLKHAGQVLDLVPEDDHHRRGAVAGLLGHAHWTVGDLEAAHRSYAECMARLQRAGYITDTIGCAVAMADIRIVQGRLHDAMRTYERAMQVAMAPDVPALRGAVDLHVGLSELLYERNDLAAANQHLLHGKALGEHMGLPRSRYRWCVAMARIREAEGDLDGALAHLDEAERLYVGDYFPNVHPLAAMKTRICVVQGRLGEALGWARERGLSADDDLSYLQEFEHITLARVLLGHAGGGPADNPMRVALGFLQRLLQAAEAGERTRSVIEILVLQARAQHGLGDISAVLVPLKRALILAEPEGYIRMFMDAGPRMANLVAQAAKHGTTPSYVRQLLKAFGVSADLPMPNQTLNQTLNRSLIEPPSDRERDVLRLLRTGLSGPEMVRELSVSLSTLRTHSQNIFSKLGVNNRRAAVRRAEELDL